MPGSGRSYGRITLDDLGRLAEISRLDREDLFARKPRYRVLEDALVCVALCQGAALHFVDGENGVKDFDVWTFYAARPDHPAFPWRRRASKDFGDPRFGPSPDKHSFAGRHVDLLGRSIEVGAEGIPPRSCADTSPKAAPVRPAPSRAKPPSCWSLGTGSGAWYGRQGIAERAFERGRGRAAGILGR